MTQNHAVSEWIIEELTRLGVRQFVISSGSRSTPLTVAAARNPNAETTIHFDERGAAFFALGHAKASGKPAVLICTSGTAVANYLPAVVEASMDNIALVILSADRPPELVDVGANQAIFQKNIFGSYPRMFKNLPPQDQHTSEKEILRDIDDLYDTATGLRPGPVHLNCQFREPLLSEFSEQEASPSSISQWASSGQRFTSITPEPAPDLTQDIQAIKDKLTACQKGIIVVGRSVHTQYYDSIVNLAQTLGMPIFADVQSALRFRIHPNIINHFDLILLNEIRLKTKPEMVIHLGGAFTSKRLLNYFNDPSIFYVSVKETPERIDPNHQVAVALITSFDNFFGAIGLEERSGEQNWLHAWQGAETQTVDAISRQMDGVASLNEPAVSNSISKLIGKQHSLMLANSMSIREMEMFASPQGFAGQIVVNRGASGIDGLIATAAGFQSGSDQPMTLLIGDLAVLHDLNSLSLLKSSQQPITLVLINNDGGGIFNFLPVRSETDIFEPFFGTPHGRTFEKVSAMFDLAYANPGDLDEFQSSYSRAIRSDHSSIIEIRTDRYKNLALHQQIFAALSES
ncbi:2-succinyl-5-enolpyruvyl-6-hydroxy-3-cyclohexene-1-carboxylic-acid synthase [bacterium]|nr:2-succinyl-5-enolpyruvyl-6-hydroxy-3-cyclohexene-1-carboxylic-acid synthase [bacterium]